MTLSLLIVSQISFYVAHKATIRTVTMSDLLTFSVAAKVSSLTELMSVVAAEELQIKRAPYFERKATLQTIIRRPILRIGRAIDFLSHIRKKNEKITNDLHKLGSRERRLP